ncbi:TetR/AcrR family transcriptional regulator [Streptomyces sp. NPDC057137]|uniref:TetR/AcrR family transcriptional regulator n=1 Tax=Streptomyces sp. NPDC057137 TaxID=3346030 RepID=UPI00363F2E5C
MSAAVSPVPLSIEMMTSRQLVRRARLIETMIELVNESGSASIQMRDVTERSGVALGTAYRYFRSKDHLQAAALVEWQGKVTRRILVSNRDPDSDVLLLVKDFLRRALQAFDRLPGMAALTVQMLASAEPEVQRLMEQNSELHVAAFDHLLAGVPEDEIPSIRLAIHCVLWDAVKRMSSGRITFQEALAQVEGVADILLGARARRSDALRGNRSERTSA